MMTSVSVGSVNVAPSLSARPRQLCCKKDHESDTLSIQDHESTVNGKRASLMGRKVPSRVSPHHGVSLHPGTYHNPLHPDCLCRTPGALSVGDVRGELPRRGDAAHEDRTLRPHEPRALRQERLRLHRLRLRRHRPGGCRRTLEGMGCREECADAGRVQGVGGGHGAGLPSGSIFQLKNCISWSLCVFTNCRLQHKIKCPVPWILHC